MDEPSSREAEVLALLGEPLTYAEIGARLFISPRTVESHVVSLRRKLGAADRRALARIHAERTAPVVALPAPLSSFVGRAEERAALAGALRVARLVSVVGAGGVGKTRLALTVAADVRAQFAGGLWYADLVPCVAPADVVAAVALALGCEPGTMAARIGAEPALLVLDNAEHVLDGVARLAEDLLGRCARLRVLVTSRSRLVVPYERVFELAGLRAAEAAVLFCARANSVEADGAPERVAAICARLGGLALAVELAAVRCPTLGLDGIEAALGDPAALLVGGPRLAGRHRSMEEVLRWSYALLDAATQRVFRRVSIFVAPFDAAAAAAVADDLDVADRLGRLCEQSLLAAIPGPDGLRYRALEPVRQLAARLLASDEADEVRGAYAAWARARLDALAGGDHASAAWCVLVDADTDDLRAAAVGGRAALGDDLARTLFARGRLADAQEVAERTAAGDGGQLATAAAIARSRVAGPDAERLERAAADAHLAAGEPIAAALALARVAELHTRWLGMFPAAPDPEETQRVLARARRLAGDDGVARHAIRVAGAHRFGASAAELRRLADSAPDAVAASAALDALAIARLGEDGVAAAAETSLARIALLAGREADPTAGLELKDAYHTAAQMLVGLGDLRGGVRCAHGQRDLPFLRGEQDHAAEELFAPAALSGEWDEAIAAAPAFAAAWERSGRPVAPGRAPSPAALALIFALLGDADESARWRTVQDAMYGDGDPRPAYRRTFEAIALLDAGRPADARIALGVRTRAFGDLVFAPWLAALTAEAAVLAGDADAASALADARAACVPDTVPAAIAARATALLAGGALSPGDFGALGAPYQERRTRALAAMRR